MREREDGAIVLSDDEYAEVLKTMPNNRGVRCDLDPSGNGFKIDMISEADLKAIDSDPTKFTVVYISWRPGGGLFATYLEHTHFPVDTPENEELGMIQYRWADMMYYVLTIPYAKKHLAYEVAEATNMKIADGVPMMGGGSDDDGAEVMDTGFGVSLKVFPMTSDRTRTLENQSGSVLYEGRGGEQDERMTERAKVEQILEEVRRTGRYTPK